MRKSYEIFNRYAENFEKETGHKAMYEIFPNNSKWLWIESEDNGGRGMYFNVEGPRDAINTLENILTGYQFAKNGKFGGFFKIIIRR